MKSLKTYQTSQASKGKEENSLMMMRVIVMTENPVNSHVIKNQKGTKPGKELQI